MVTRKRMIDEKALIRITIIGTGPSNVREWYKDQGAWTGSFSHFLSPTRRPGA